MRYRIDLQYRGNKFHGWQSQLDGSGVQNSLEEALSLALRNPTKIIGASRTDSGVHAEHQVAVFDHPGELNLRELRGHLNGILVKDIGVDSLKPVQDDFHPIVSARSKTYRYQLWLSERRDPFLEPYVWRQTKLDRSLIEKAAEVFVGEHDFTSFCAADSGAKTKIRRIDSIKFHEIGELMQIRFQGNGFLKQMVRTLVGTLVEVGNSKRGIETLGELLAARDRSLSGPTAPARALFLERIDY